MTPEQKSRLRALPAVSELLGDDRVRSWCERSGKSDVAHALRTALEDARTAIVDNGSAGNRFNTETILRAAAEHLANRTVPSLKRVINATGVVLHTGLGRAPLPRAALDAIVNGAAGYTNLEYDLETGRRGSRQSHVSALLCRLTGAEAATVVNNNAAAMLLIMRALCEDREVIVSRGQLVEIGGSFRMPDIMKAGGDVLREVGTTNRTRIADYDHAVTENTAALLRVHHSNFRIVGFTEEPTLDELTRCAHQHDVLAIDDLGSGAMFDPATLGLPSEPFVAQSMYAGFDIVCFSGDKLLGGPQAGIILGRKDLIERIESHPLMRSYRLDKLVLLALEATLRCHTDSDRAVKTIPTLAMLNASTDELAERARTLAEMLTGALPAERFFVSSDTSYAGGGSLPGEGLETVVVRWRPSLSSAGRVATQLRHADFPVVARVADDHIILDLRTIAPDEFAPLLDSIQIAASVVSQY